MTRVQFVIFIQFVIHTYNDAGRAHIRAGCYCQEGKVRDSCVFRDIYIVRDSYIS